jgi:hypothetical protein
VESRLVLLKDVQLASCEYLALVSLIGHFLVLRLENMASLHPQVQQQGTHKGIFSLLQCWAHEAAQYKA